MDPQSNFTGFLQDDGKSVFLDFLNIFSKPAPDKLNQILEIISNLQCSDEKKEYLKSRLIKLYKKDVEYNDILYMASLNALIFTKHRCDKTGNFKKMCDCKIMVNVNRALEKFLNE